VKADATPLTQVINPGLLTLTPATQAQLSAVTLNHTQGQTSSGSLGTLTVDDSRGAFVGWSVTATATNLVSYGSGVFNDDNNVPSPFTVSGTYTGNNDVDYTLLIDGSLGTRLGKLTYRLLNNPATIASGTLLASQPIGSTGLTLNAPDITYPAQGVYYLHLHVIPVTGLTITPGNVAALSGSVQNVTAGEPHTFTSVSDPAAIVGSPIGFGDGLYQAGAALKLSIPAGTQPGTYSGQIIETIN
jgi:hypothetical protein